MRPNGDPRYSKLVDDDTENPNPKGDCPNANSNYNAGNSKGPGPDEKCDPVNVLFVLFALTGGVIGLSFWLSRHPDFPDISVSSFEVSGFNLSSNSLTSAFDVSIAIRNPNKMSGIGFEDVKAAVLYSTGDVDMTVLDADDFVIAKTPVFPFSLGPRSVTDLRARMAAAGLHVDDEGAIRSGDGDLRFGVRVSLTVAFKRIWPADKYYDLKVYCDGVRVGMKSPTAAAGVGSMVGPAGACQKFTI